MSFKPFKLTQKTSGFTLIELLVAMVIAALVIAPLMGFMVNLMNSDRKEQAKATSEHEIQAALDYIAQDLQQAVYIYDADGLEKNSTDNPPGIKNQIPPVTAVRGCGNPTATCVPVLVFWKREVREKVLPVTGSPNRDDAFVYSLVAYYLIKGNNENGTWSNAARIGRFQIRDGFVDPNDPTNNDGTPKYITSPDPSKDGNPSKGFNLFDLTVAGTNLKDRMNRWQKGNENYTDNAFTLVDFIDQNPNVQTPNCLTNTQKVPSTSVGGFYACVDSSKTSAQIYLRGNALERLQNNSTYSDNNSNYFPNTNIQIQGRGLLGTN